MACKGLLAWIALLCVPASAVANQVPEPTFQEKLADSDLVVIATTTSVNRGDKYGVGANAKLTVIQTLKGDKQASIEVSTYSDIAELDPGCCDPGATYMMFLKRGPTGSLSSSWGRYGMVRIGGQLSYETAATLPQGCKTRPQPGSLIFRGSSEALARLQLFATGQGASLRSCMEGRSQVLVLSGGNDAKLATANNFLRAYDEGKLPDVEVGVVGW